MTSEKNALFEVLFEYNPSETIVVDRNCKITMINKAKRDAVSRQPKIGDVMYVDYASKHEIDMHKELVGCIERKKQKFFREVSYDEEFLNIKIVPFTDGAMIISENVTEFVITRMDLEERLEELRVITDTAQDAIIVMGGDQKVAYWNQSAEKILGYTKQEAIGKILHDLIAPEDKREMCARGVRRFLETGESTVIGLTTEQSAVRKDGKMINIELSLSAFRSRKGWQVVGIVRDVTQRKAEKDALYESRELFRHMAITDSLTDLYNRLYFTDELKQEIARARRYKQSLSVILFDVDDFKLINDRYGHDRGDEVLKYIARIVQKNIRKNDIPCRYGGEEFAILLPMTSEKVAESIAERMRVMLETAHFDFMSEKVTVSIGVSQLREGDNFNSLVKRVDDLMYSVKKQGKNSVAVE